MYMLQFTGAIKSNCQTAETSKRTLEGELQKWFGNARDRGSDSRKKVKRVDIIDASISDT